MLLFVCACVAFACACACAHKRVNNMTIQHHVICSREDTDASRERPTAESLSACLVEFTLAVVHESESVTARPPVPDPVPLSPSLIVPSVACLLLLLADVTSEASYGGGNVSNNSNWREDARAHAREFVRENVAVLEQEEPNDGAETFTLHMRGLLECVMTYVFGAVASDNGACIENEARCSCRQCAAGVCRCRSALDEYWRLKQVNG